MRGFAVTLSGKEAVADAHGPAVLETPHRLSGKQGQDVCLRHAADFSDLRSGRYTEDIGQAIAQIEGLDEA